MDKTTSSTILSDNKCPAIGNHAGDLELKSKKKEKFFKKHKVRSNYKKSLNLKSEGTKPKVALKKLKQSPMLS